MVGRRDGQMVLRICWFKRAFWKVAGHQVIAMGDNQCNLPPIIARERHARIGINHPLDGGKIRLIEGEPLAQPILVKRTNPVAKHKFRETNKTRNPDDRDCKVN